VIRNGIRRIWVAESMNDVETDLRIARIAKEEGADEVLVGLVYSISPVHTDAYYADRAREIAASNDVDVLNLKDPGGLLTPERVRTLVPALRAAAPTLPLEVHSHCTATMAPLVYLESARLGASFVLHRSAAACERYVAAVGGADTREPSAPKASPWSSTTLRSRRCRRTSRRSRRGSGGRPACRSSTTCRSTGISFRAA
jgi:Pyruvate/oxaloacetate carboxyltransferase